MEKLQSSFKNMVLSLVIICVVAAGALAGVYLLTLATINAQKTAKQQAAVLAVLPEGAVIDEIEEIDGMTVYNAMKDGVYAGAAVQTEANGFGGPQKIMVGFDADGKIVNYEVLEHQETPGLGDKIVDWFKNADKPGQNIIGRQATGQFIVSKDGGDVDAITAATISSRAFLKAINQAYAALHDDVEAHTGASQLNSRESRVESQESRDESEELRVESKESRVKSRESRVESQEIIEKEVNNE